MSGGEEAEQEQVKLEEGEGNTGERESGWEKRWRAVEIVVGPSVPRIATLTLQLHTV